MRTTVGKRQGNGVIHGITEQQSYMDCCQRAFWPLGKDECCNNIWSKSIWYKKSFVRNHLKFRREMILDIILWAFC